jgi:hypothetical protein
MAKKTFISSANAQLVPGSLRGAGSDLLAPFRHGCGEMSEAQFTDSLAGIFWHMAFNSVDGAIHQICIDWRHMSEFLTADHQVMLAPTFLAFVREPWLADKSKSTQNAMVPCKARQTIRDTERVAESSISRHVLSQRY